MRAPGEISLDQENKRGHSTFELEVHKQGNVIHALPALGQFSEDQKATPSLPLFGQAHTLPDGGQWLEIAFGNAARANDADRTDPAVCQKNVGDDDGDGKNPFGNLEVDGRLNLAGPFVESEEIDGSESIGGVDTT